MKRNDRVNRLSYEPELPDLPRQNSGGRGGILVFVTWDHSGGELWGPSVFLRQGMEEEMLKYYDWYFATGRYEVRSATSLAEAKETETPEIARTGRTEGGTATELSL